MDYEIDHSILDGPDFVVHEWWDETSQFDNHPSVRWMGGTECYERRYRCRVPPGLTEDEIFDWIDRNEGRIKYLD